MTNTLYYGENLQALRLRYASRQSFLCGACFYDGVTELEEDLIADIRETLDYIRDAEALAWEYNVLEPED